VQEAAKEIGPALGRETVERMLGKGALPGAEIAEMRALQSPLGPPPGLPPGAEQSLQGLPITPDMVAAGGNMMGALNMSGAALPNMMEGAPPLPEEM
jgi:hypothetical protein